MLILARKSGESLMIGDNIEIVITEISGDKVKIGINAPKEVTVLRKELCQTVDENRQAVQEVPGDALRLLAANFKSAHHS
ncbi:MAG: carbon storage regulator CsrA [Angelakisella sp.]